MKFYKGGRIDSQGRFCLGGFIEPRTQIEIWVEDIDFDLIHVKRHLELDKDIPSYAIRRTDAKSRVIIPKIFRRNATYALIARDNQSGIVLKLFFDKYDDNENADADVDSEGDNDVSEPT